MGADRFFKQPHKLESVVEPFVVEVSVKPGPEMASVLDEELIVGNATETKEEKSQVFDVAGVGTSTELPELSKGRRRFIVGGAAAVLLAIIVSNVNDSEPSLNNSMEVETTTTTSVLDNASHLPILSEIGFTDPDETTSTSSSTTTSTTTTSISDTAITSEVSNTVAPAPEPTINPNINEYGLLKTIAEFRGNYFDCNGIIVFGEIPGLWPSIMASRCDNVNGELGYTLQTIMANNPQIQADEGTKALDYIRNGQILNLGPGLPDVPFLGLRDFGTSTVDSLSDSGSSSLATSSRIGIESYRNECDKAGGSMGSSSSSTLTKYITSVLGRSSAEAIGFSRIHPILADGWSRFGTGNYCLLGNVDLSIYD
jgi:hypothetical protein